MKTAEELAKEYYPNLDLNEVIISKDNQFTINDIRLLERVAFMAGHDEATRWRPVNELPEDGFIAEIICKNKDFKAIIKSEINGKKNTEWVKMFFTHWRLI